MYVAPRRHRVCRHCRHQCCHQMSATTNTVYHIHRHSKAQMSRWNERMSSFKMRLFFQAYASAYVLVTISPSAQWNEWMKMRITAFRFSFYSIFFHILSFHFLLFFFSIATGFLCSCVATHQSLLCDYEFKCEGKSPIIVCSKKKKKMLCVSA